MSATTRQPSVSRETSAQRVANASTPPVCDYEGSRYRTEFWEGQGREYEDAVERIALQHLLPPVGKRLIDVGAGFGRLADLYRGYEQVILLDYSRSLLREARERLGDERYIYVAANLYELPLADASVDTVVTVRVLHHVQDLGAAFQQFARVLRPGGIYTLEFANKRHLKAILRYWTGRQTESPFTIRPYEFAELNFNFHPEYVSNYLRSAGFVVEERRAVSSFRMATLKQRFSPRLLAFADALLQRPTAPLALAPSIFLRARVEKPGFRRLSEALWRCPRCHATGLAETPTFLECPECKARWPIEDGIFNFKAAQG